MAGLEQFAKAPQTGEGHYFRNNVIAPEIIKFLEDESDLRQFLTPKKMDGALSKTFRVEKEEGIAVQIAGNSEVPREEDVRRLFTVYLHRNATGYKIDDDDRKINRDDAGYESRKLQAAMRRMLKKENKDIMDVMFAAAQTVTTIPAGDKFDVDAINDAIVRMIANAKASNGNVVIEPDVILMPYTFFAELQQDPKFQFVPEIYQRILLNATFDGSGNRGIIYGDTGQVVAGLRIIVVNELDNTAIILDSNKDALWLVEDTEPTITQYRDDEHISDITDIRHDQQPVCIWPECLASIKKSQ